MLAASREPGNALCPPAHPGYSIGMETPLATPDWIARDPAAVAAALGLDPADIRIEPRDDRFAAFLPGDRIAWFPANPAGAARLAREARVLALLANHCRFATPRLLATGPNWQLRAAVPGTVDPWSTYQRVLADPGYARALGAQLGTMIADQHQSIPPADLVGWLPERSAWPYPLARIAADLPHVVTDRALIETCLTTIDTYERAATTVTDRVLTHGDLGLHNVALAPDGAVAGIFDYDDAALADRHTDFRYLLFDNLDDAMLEAAIAAYRASGGPAIDPTRVALFNAASAIGFLADRRGSGPDERPAGRTLEADLAWTRLALSRLS